MVIDDKAVETGSLTVGYPLRRDDGLVLVALPRETDRGSFRAWIPTADVLSN